MFYFDPDKAPYPILALGFEDRAAATQIFKGLINQLGEIQLKTGLVAISTVRHMPHASPCFLACANSPILSARSG
jgi:hypothetical protein